MSDEKQLIHHGNLIDLYKEKVDLENGKHTYFDIVKHPGGAVIAAINKQQKICLIKQWRHAVGEWIWEFPAGCLEANEAPLLSAQRELEEEAGIIAQQWQDLGKTLPSPGFSNEVLYFFLARELSQGTVKLDEAERLEAHWLSLKKVESMALNGEIDDSKTLALLYRLKLFLT